jgi:hypothetical protein
MNGGLLKCNYLITTIVDEHKLKFLFGFREYFEGFGKNELQQIIQS